MLRKIYPGVEATAQGVLDLHNERAAHYRNNAQNWAEQVEKYQAVIGSAKVELATAREGTNRRVILQNRISQQEIRLQNATRAYNRAMQQAESYQARAAAQADNMRKGEHLGNRRVQYRKDYFHHFQEMEGGIGGIMNILNSPHDIAPGLAANSEFAKPKSRWASFMQRRQGGAYTADAVGGMKRYIRAAEYKLAFDPFIAEMRALNNEIIRQASEQNTTNANNLILWLNDWTNDIAGKSNNLDRVLSETINNRKGMEIFIKFNNNVK